LEKTVEEKREYLHNADFKLQFEINDLLEARDSCHFSLNFCADFAPILRRFFTQKVGLRPIYLKPFLQNEIIEKPFIYWDSR
jgi:hypothetical protein